MDVDPAAERKVGVGDRSDVLTGRGARGPTEDAGDQGQEHGQQGGGEEQVFGRVSNALALPPPREREATREQQQPESAKPDAGMPVNGSSPEGAGVSPVPPVPPPVPPRGHLHFSDLDSSCGESGPRSPRAPRALHSYGGGGAATTKVNGADEHVAPSAIVDLDRVLRSRRRVRPRPRRRRSRAGRRLRGHGAKGRFRRSP